MAFGKKKKEKINEVELVGHVIAGATWMPPMEDAEDIAKREKEEEQKKAAIKRQEEIKAYNEYYKNRDKFNLPIVRLQDNKGYPIGKFPEGMSGTNDTYSYFDINQEVRIRISNNLCPDIGVIKAIFTDRSGTDYSYIKKQNLACWLEAQKYDAYFRFRDPDNPVPPKHPDDRNREKAVPPGIRLEGLCGLMKEYPDIMPDKYRELFDGRNYLNTPLPEDMPDIAQIADGFEYYQTKKGASIAQYEKYVVRLRQYMESETGITRPILARFGTICRPLLETDEARLTDIVLSLQEALREAVPYTIEIIPPYFFKDTEECREGKRIKLSGDESGITIHAPKNEEYYEGIYTYDDLKNNRLDIRGEIMNIINFSVNPEYRNPQYDYERIIQKYKHTEVSLTRLDKEKNEIHINKIDEITAKGKTPSEAELIDIAYELAVELNKYEQLKNAGRLRRYEIEIGNPRFNCPKSFERAKEGWKAYRNEKAYFMDADYAELKESGELEQRKYPYVGKDKPAPHTAPRDYEGETRRPAWDDNMKYSSDIDEIV